jgi:hypothetical protein
MSIFDWAFAKKMSSKFGGTLKIDRLQSVPLGYSYTSVVLQAIGYDIKSDAIGKLLGT